MKIQQFTTVLVAAALGASGAAASNGAVKDQAYWANAYIAAETAEAPAPEQQYYVEPDTKEVISWVMVGTGGALMAAGLGLNIANLVVGTAASETVMSKLQSPETSAAHEADYKQQRSVADGLYIGGVAAAIAGAVTLASGLVLYFLPDEILEEK